MASLIPPQFVVKLEANKGIDNDDDSGLACVQYFIIERWRNQKKPNTEFHDIRKVNISQKMTKNTQFYELTIGKSILKPSVVCVTTLKSWQIQIGWH